MTQVGFNGNNASHTKTADVKKDDALANMFAKLKAKGESEVDQIDINFGQRKRGEHF